MINNKFKQIDGDLEFKYILYSLVLFLMLDNDF
jgi:hypothetical protein